MEKGEGMTATLEREQIVPPIESDIFRRRQSESGSGWPVKLDNEYENTSVPVLRTLKRVEVEETKSYPPYAKEIVDHTLEIEREFVYLARVGDLETGTPKTQILQEQVDKMLEGKGMQTRVVVMRKGAAPDAFVFADGTIFVMQSLLNKLDSLDEVAAVLAHEVEHLENKTFENRIVSHTNYFGVSWAHEAMADQFTPVLLEKAGLEALAFGPAIQRVQGFERGLSHQSGGARSSQLLAHAVVRNYTTSGQPHIPKSTEFSGETRKSNYEYFQEVFPDRYDAKLDVGKIREVLLHLHPKDFRVAYREIANSQSDWGNWRERKLALIAANDIIGGRLKDAGFSESEIAAFLVCTDDGYTSNNTYLADTKEKFEAIVAALPTMDREGKFTKASGTIFDDERLGYSWKQGILTHTEQRGYFVELENGRDKKPGIPMTEESFLNLLEAVSRDHETGRIDEMFSATVTKRILNYVDRIFLKNAEEAGVEVDREQIKAFFEEVKSRGLPIKGNEIERYRGFDEEPKLTTENRKIVKEVFCEVFEYQPLESEVNLTFEDIDRFVDEIEEQWNLPNTDREREVLQGFIEKANQYFWKNNLEEKERVRFIEYLDQKILLKRFNCSFSYARLLNAESNVSELE